MFDAELAQAGDPLQDRLGIEAELGDDVDRQAGGLRGLDLVGERAVEVLLRYARMAIGLAVHIVTQFGFDAQAILQWIARLREFGVEHPVRIGLAGPTNLATLLRYAQRC